MNFSNDQLDSVARFKSWWMNKSNILVLDTETTGLGNYDEIAEVSLIDMDENVIFDSLVKPRRAIPRDASKIHGITDEMVKFSPPWPIVWPQLLKLIGNKEILIYNAAYDIRMIRQSCRNYGLSEPSLRASCVMEEYAAIYGNWNDWHQSYTWVKLDDAIRTEKIQPFGKSHRALADCVHTARLVKKIAMRSLL